ncbi:MAG: hypothetical protein OXH86_13210 [Acidimicrobiaceae bacterium]|nr:hypothetical protein [Acidimicrobiaceae bacterium]MDE0498304.1 hypothetical protein [Acidimicrobiaceae bacterium]
MTQVRTRAVAVSRFLAYARRKPGHLAGWCIAWFVLASILDYALSTSGPSTGDGWQFFVASIYFLIAPAILACVFLVIWGCSAVIRRRSGGLPSPDEARDAANRRAAVSGRSSRI